jgi:hypothetical protein
VRIAGLFAFDRVRLSFLPSANADEPPSELMSWWDNFQNLSSLSPSVPVIHRAWLGLSNSSMLSTGV